MLGSVVGEGTLAPAPRPTRLPVTAHPLPSWVPQGVVLHVRMPSEESRGCRISSGDVFGAFSGL